MKELDEKGTTLLKYLVAFLPEAIPGQPETYVNYKKVHDDLGLNLLGTTYGESLKVQGLTNLADWTAENENIPAITGLIIDQESFLPGKGYFSLFKKTEEDFDWWAEQIKLAKDFNWSRYVSKEAIELSQPDTPVAPDITEPPGGEYVTTYRIIRDTQLAKKVKRLNGYRCQICKSTITLPNGNRYAEAHHIKPLGKPHTGPDIIGNILCLCPNHHAELDYGVTKIERLKLIIVDGHDVQDEYLKYHNEEIFGKSP